MFDFLNKSYPFNTDLGYTLKLGSGIAIGIFLFILFFQPLELDNTNVENYILTIAGFAGIALLLMGLVKIIIPSLFRRLINIERWDLKREVIQQLLIWILNAVAFSFYLAYVGRVPLTMYLAFKTVLICLSMPVVIIISNEIYNLKTQVTKLEFKTREMQEKLGEDTAEIRPPVEIVAENRSEKLVVEAEALILVRSAENYVEILFRENDEVQKKLMRATMKSIEDQLSGFAEMVRCHRTCIVNTRMVEKLHRGAQGIKLRIVDYEEEIPVSRQYLLAVKAALDKAG